MIIVVEGISAAGKTTFTRRAGADFCIPEFETNGPPPASQAPIGEHAQFWVDHNTRRFQAALDMEERCGGALCDTEPMKSHFDWCRARAGFTSMDLFNHSVPLLRNAIREGRLGFADRYLVKRIDPDTARAQKESDATRTRRNFEMHLALQPHLIDWFTALAKVLPGQVEFGWPEPEELAKDFHAQMPEASPRRFDVSVLDALLKELPR